MKKKNPPRNGTMEARPIHPKPCSMTVDAAYVYVVMDTGQLLVGTRSPQGIRWAEAEPIPGTPRAAEIASLREQVRRKAEGVRDDEA